MKRDAIFSNKYVKDVKTITPLTRRYRVRFLFYHLFITGTSFYTKLIWTDS